jgi:diaminohydroxyphosphoribosylaminopyrimidine deaminase/5-amino-6-(5-phosphoribosylamino)uracil reductase
VIVRDREIVGEGWHQMAGEPHAEIHALQMAKERAQNSTCYVTLEPCCHHGRTPPCTEAIIKAGVTRVVVAMTDPNPLVSSKGIEQLLKAGVVVDTGILSSEAEKLNPGFLTRMRHKRPYIRCKIAMSVDGKTAMASGESQWITSQESRADVQAMRARSSAIMTGAGTVLADNPQLSVRESELPKHLYRPPIIKQPIRVVVDAHLSTPPTARMLTLPGQTLIFTASDDEFLTKSLEKAGAKVVFLPERERHIDLSAMCQKLATDHDVNELLVETGANLAGSLLRAKLIDEIIIYMAPVLLGHKARGLFHLPELETLSQKIRLNITEIRALGNDWRMTIHPV